jgi:asparagine synthase (glutamine-hydrolysing)
MCGICGIINSNRPIETDQLLSMTRVLRHRGPDDEGFILGNTEQNIIKTFHHDETIDSIKSRTLRLENNFNANFGFGFRRLSILDLSENGHQPMQFEEASLWIVFNGEIYNYLELREELKQYGYKFNSNTDTEVILKAYHKWGEDCVHKFNGMWAFAIWDSKNKQLFCSRDRFGIKPFYYFFKEKEQFIFASEVKSILHLIKTIPDQQSLFDYFAYGYSDHNERTFFYNFKQLRGGHNLILRNGNLSISRYHWIKSQPCQDSFEKAKEKLRELLFDAVRIRLRSDVPLGYALSGGIDSSSIVAIASKINSGSNNTFSIIYPGDKVDESFYIKKVIEKTGVSPHFVSPTMKNFMDDFQNFTYQIEQPFTGLSHFGDFKLRELIKSNCVTVSLDGQGADEIVTGYYDSFSIYYQGLLRQGKLLPFINAKDISLKNEMKILIKDLFIKKNDINSIFKKYNYLNFAEVSIDYISRDYAFNDKIKGEFLNQKLYLKLKYTSIPTLLTKADKIAMANSVESRYPFLDYRVAEYALNLPAKYKIHNGFTKYILRESVKDLLPIEVYDRTDKVGFEIPTNKFKNNFHRVNLVDRLKNINTSNLPLIQKDKFISFYNSTGYHLDWKFWKTASVLLWYDTFFNY